MEDDREVLKELEEDDENVEPLPPQPPRKKGYSRAYFGAVAFGMFIFLLLSVIALGSFGAKQAQLPGFFNRDIELGYTKGDLCLLFVNSRLNPDSTSPVKVIYDELPRKAPCVFIFWGLTSGTILAFALLIYSIVMLVIGSRVLNWPRIVDCILSFCGCIGFFAYSVTLTAGLNKTCAGFTAAGFSCAGSYFLNSSLHELYFYASVAAAKNCSWIITIALFIYSVWNLILVIFYFRQRIKKRQMARINQGDFPAASSLTNPVELPPPYLDVVKE